MALLQTKTRETQGRLPTPPVLLRKIHAKLVQHVSCAGDDEKRHRNVRAAKDDHATTTKPTHNGGGGTVYDVLAGVTATSLIITTHQYYLVGPQSLFR